MLASVSLAQEGTLMETVLSVAAFAGLVIVWVLAPKRA